MENLIWFKQSGFLWDENTKIYIDPWDISEEYPKADFIFITHAHYDHFSKDTISRLLKEGTVVVAPHDVAGQLEAATIAVAPWETHAFKGISFKTIPAYNIKKPYHPRENNWVGYILTIGNKTYYHAGDTDRIPEMKEIESDVAMLPIGGTYTMDASEAAQAVSEDIKSSLAIPMHYGFVVGQSHDAETFKKLTKVPVEILIPKIPFSQ